MFVFIGGLLAYPMPTSAWQHFRDAYRYTDRFLTPRNNIEPYIPPLDQWPLTFALTTYVSMHKVITLLNSMDCNYILHYRMKNLDSPHGPDDFFVYFLEVSDADAFILRMCCPWIMQHLESIT